MQSNYQGDSGHQAHVDASKALKRKTDNPNTQPAVSPTYDGPSGAATELAPALARKPGELVQDSNKRRQAAAKKGQE